MISPPSPVAVQVAMGLQPSNPPRPRGGGRSRRLLGVQLEDPDRARNITHAEHRVSQAVQLSFREVARVRLGRAQPMVEAIAPSTPFSLMMGTRFRAVESRGGVYG